MPTTITSAGITFNDATSLTSANIGSSQIAANAVGATQIAANAVGATQIANGSVTAAKLGTTEQKQIAKAWVNFNGTTSPGTIRSSYNVSSVTKNGTGDYTVNFATAMADANYSVFSTNETIAGTPYGFSGPYSVSTSTINSCRLSFVGGATGTAADRNYCSVAIFGN